MATPMIERDLPAVGHHARGEAGRMLQSTLVELIALSLIGKQLHWNIIGPEFRSLHLHLDQPWTSGKSSGPRRRTRGRGRVPSRRARPDSR